MLQTFCEILSCPEPGEAAVVAPAFEVDTLLREAKRLNVRISQILITHGHTDHVDGIAEMVEHTGATVLVNPREVDKVKEAIASTSAAGATIRTGVDGDTVTIGKRGLRAGDARSHRWRHLLPRRRLHRHRRRGRTDFTGGNTAELWQSLQRLTALPEERRVYPGHNYGTTPTSTIGWPRPTSTQRWPGPVGTDECPLCGVERCPPLAARSRRRSGHSARPGFSRQRRHVHIDGGRGRANGQTPVRPPTDFGERSRPDLGGLRRCGGALEDPFDHRCSPRARQRTISRRTRPWPERDSSGNRGPLPPRGTACGCPDDRRMCARQRRSVGIGNARDLARRRSPVTFPGCLR